MKLDRYLLCSTTATLILTCICSYLFFIGDIDVYLFGKWFRLCEPRRFWLYVEVLGGVCFLLVHILCMVRKRGAYEKYGFSC